MGSIEVRVMYMNLDPSYLRGRSSSNLKARQGHGGKASEN